MASGPDLFVVCRSCGREVSPYITECPYCGNRLRKRAPKLERGAPKPPKAPRRRPSLGRLRPGEIPGIRADRRPYATFALVLAAVIVSIGARAGAWSLLDIALTEKGLALRPDGCDAAFSMVGVSGETLESIQELAGRLTRIAEQLNAHAQGRGPAPQG